MEVLTKLKTISQGSYTYNLMSNNMVHINNHKTNDKSVIVPLDSILKLTENNDDEQNQNNPKPHTKR